MHTGGDILKCRPSSANTFVDTVVYAHYRMTIGVASKGQPTARTTRYTDEDPQLNQQRFLRGNMIAFDDPSRCPYSTTQPWGMYPDSASRNK